jgi:tRNA G18 (ribose-2'-O)-methylase SpoU
MGRANFVNGDGTHGDRVFTPVGKGPDSLQVSEQAEGAPTACWLPEGILTRLAASIKRVDLLSHTVSWDDLSIGRGRLNTSVGDAPARRELIVVASLVEKTPNIAGLCRTCEMLHASSLVVADRVSFTDAQFAPISLQTETWLPITEVPPTWLMAYLEEQRTLGYQIIAVEQTSTSTTLEEFCWPEKAVLLLGKVSLTRQLCIERRPLSCDRQMPTLNSHSA